MEDKTYAKLYAKANRLNVIFFDNKSFLGNYKSTKLIIGTTYRNLIIRSKGLDRETTVFLVSEMDHQIEGSMISAISLLNKFRVSNTFSLNEKVIRLS